MKSLARRILRRPTSRVEIPILSEIVIGPSTGWTPLRHSRSCPRRRPMIDRIDVRERSGVSGTIVNVSNRGFSRGAETGGHGGKGMSRKTNREKSSLET